MRLLEPASAFHKEYRVIRLHLDDIEELLAVLEKSGFIVSISDARFEYDTIAEVIEKQGVRPSELYLHWERKTPKAAVEISVTGHRARIDSDQAVELGMLATELDAILRARDNPVLRSLNPNAFAVLAAISFFLEQMGFQATVQGGKDVTAYIPWAFVLAAVLALALRSALTGLFLTRRHEGGFLKRNADKIWLLLIGAVVGVVGTLVVKMLSK